MLRVGAGAAVAITYREQDAAAQGQRQRDRMVGNLGRAVIRHVEHRDALCAPGGEIERVEIDKPLGREVLVRTVASGVCHSDLHFVEGFYPFPTPAILGHPTLQISLRSNWWGLAGEQIHVEAAADRANPVARRPSRGAFAIASSLPVKA